MFLKIIRASIWGSRSLASLKVRTSLAGTFGALDSSHSFGVLVVRRSIERWERKDFGIDLNSFSALLLSYGVIIHVLCSLDKPQDPVL